MDFPNKEFVDSFYRSYTRRAQEAAAVELLDRSIVVTNVKDRPAPPSNHTYIYYYANVSNDFLLVLKVAVLENWMRHMHNGVEPLAPMAGMRRGFLEFAPFVLMENMSSSQAERDILEDMGLNAIRFMPGQGIFLWGTTIWKDGKEVPKTDPFNVACHACVGALVPRYGMYN